MKFEGLEKGMKSKTDLWISEINMQIQAKSGSKPTIPEHKKYHSECLEFIKTQITPMRVKYSKILAKEEEQARVKA